jgi:hypothetical protein
MSPQLICWAWATFEPARKRKAKKDNGYHDSVPDHAIFAAKRLKVLDG